MKTGKLAPESLRRLLTGRLGARRADVLVHAALGEDAAAVDFGAEACVVSVDPITGAGRRAGWLGVHVACNDIAAMGAEPIGVLATLLIPESATETDVTALMDDVHRAALELGIEVLGGHTEITPGLASPLLSMAALGRAPRDRVIRSSGARPGDVLVLAKWAGLEGTAILATDLAHVLRGQVADETLEAARGLIDLVSVVPEGRAAARLGATAMHDPTEGGLLGALWELAEASGCGFDLEAERVPVRPETRAICAVFRADPLKLISSGALLIVCPDGPGMVRGLAAEGLQAAEIGRITLAERTIVRSGRREPADAVVRDELWRILEQYSA